MAEQQQYFEYLMKRSRWGAAYRRLLLYPRLCKRLRGRTLDIGCGIGDMLQFRRDTVGTDINDATVRYCRSLGLDAHVMSPEKLPFEAQSFDSALLDNVMEHIERPQPLLEEVRRVLKPGGRLLVGVPGSLGYASDPDHKVFYDEASLVHRVELQGFRHRETFHTPLWRSAWMERSVRQYCVYALFDVANCNRSSMK